MRIRGLVATANRVREQLKVGIPKQELSLFKSCIQQTLLTVEQLCALEGKTPRQLPVPSRKAYSFLKQIDFEQIPIGTGESQSEKKLRLANIKYAHHTIQTQLWDLISAGPPKRSTIKTIEKTLIEQSNIIEQVCEQEGLTPSHLEGFSRSHYSWLKFLQAPEYLDAHLYALGGLKQQIEQFMELTVKGFSHQKFKGDRPQLWIEFMPIQALYRHAHQTNKLVIRVNEGFITADNNLIRTLGQQIIFGKSSERSRRIRQFSISDEYREVFLKIDSILGRQSGIAQGRIHDLDRIFNQNNQTYFDGKLSKPSLVWSDTFTYRKFGHYCRSRDQIMLSQTLDDEKISEVVVAFVMYHEMLHIKHGAQWKNGKLWVHTPAFRRDERLFPQYEAVEQELGKIAQQIA